MVPSISTLLSSSKTGENAWVILFVSISFSCRNAEGQGSGNVFYLNTFAFEDLSVNTDGELFGTFDFCAFAGTHFKKSVKKRVADMFAFYINTDEFCDF